ncbi:uncharacterized protein LOC103361797 [Stegastes partitus]|uniref:Uncharacterized protein LOC103361797 n=1 Tax=Stegastes partitus TaxID=144197 RepID=A0A9Y4K8D3_9TELE|nr:PREDICTED: uncharacterized protein LOC103361797 [Stegastes partitus]
MIIAVLAATALVKGLTECNFSHSHGTRQCFGALGQPLIFHLSDKTNTLIRLTKDGKYMILKREKTGNVILDDKFVDPSELTHNGKFKLLNAMKIHSGDYELEEHSSDGTLIRQVIVHLEIQGPVSKPVVSQTCLSEKQMQVSCSTEGDNVEFLMTLDGYVLIQTSDYNQSLSSWTAEKLCVDIKLYGQLTGNVTCRVWNKVSRDETVHPLSACGGAAGFVPTLPVVTAAVIASAATAFSFLALSLVIVFWKKRRQIPTSPTSVDEDNRESEVIYTDVKVKKKPRQTRSEEHQNAT